MLDAIFGDAVLRELQLPGDAPGSIVYSLPEAARKFPLTSIQSKTDYLINNENLPVCDIGCIRSDNVKVGRGTQFWPNAPHKLYDNYELGGNGFAMEPLKRISMIRWLFANHNAPLRHDLTAQWMAEAVRHEPLADLVYLVELPEFPMVDPGAKTSITFTLQNTSLETWPAGDYSLVLVAGERLSGESQIAMDVDVPPGAAVQWIVSLTAPELPGVYRTTWQFSYRGDLGGPPVLADVIVVPGGSSSEFKAIVQSLIDQADELWQTQRENFEAEWNKVVTQIVGKIVEEVTRIQIQLMAFIWGQLAPAVQAAIRFCVSVIVALIVLGLILGWMQRSG
jgi:hypothetical protein